MSKLFYDHLLVINEIVVELDGIDLKDRQEFLGIIDETLHHHVLDVILTHLPKEHHESFLDRFHKAPNDPTLLSSIQKLTAVDIEKAITERVQKIKKKTLSAINRARVSHLK